MKRFRRGHEFKAHGLVYHSTLGWRVIKKMKKKGSNFALEEAKAALQSISIVIVNNKLTILWGS